MPSASASTSSGTAGDAQLHAFVEGQLQLGGGREAAVDAGVGADHVDIEAGDAALADLLDRVRHPVHRADPVGDQGDPAAVLVAAAQLRLLGAEEGGRGRVGEGRDERLEDAVGGGAEVAALEGGEPLVDGDAEAALVAAAGAAVEVGVGEAVGLQHLEQLAAADLDPDPGEPGLEQAAGVLGADVGGDLALAGVALADHPFGHLQDRGRVGGLAGDLDARVVERAGGERHRGVRPLRGGTLFAPRFGLAVAHQGEKLFRRGGGRHLGPGAADVHAGVVVGAADPGAAVGVDVDGGGHVQLRGARPVADLPDREELGQPAPVAPCERRRDVEEGVRQRAGDLVLVQVRGTGLDVAGVGLQPLMVSGSDPVTEDVNRLGLAGEANGQLLGDEGVGKVDRSRAHRRSCRDR